MCTCMPVRVGSKRREITPNARIFTLGLVSCNSLMLDACTPDAFMCSVYKVWLVPHESRTYTALVITVCLSTDSASKGRDLSC